MEKIIKYSFALLIVFLLLTGKSLANPYAPYKGTTVVLTKDPYYHPHFIALKKVLPEFTKETGIKVVVDNRSWFLRCARGADPVECYSRRDTMYGGDLGHYRMDSKAEFLFEEKLENLSRYFMNPRLADPDYDANDLVDAYLQVIGIAGGKKGYLPGKTGSLFGLPFGAETSALAYRKDIFEKHGLKVPETYEELLDVACKIPNLEPEMYGIVSRVGRSSSAFLLHLNPLGGGVFDKHWNPILNNEVGVKAVKTLKKIIQCGPNKGAAEFSFGKSLRTFIQGDAAMYLDTTLVAPRMNDPMWSNVAGKVAWTLHPKGVQRSSLTGGFGLAIPKNAKNKEAAFLLMQWLTSKKGDKLIALAGGQPSRFSTYFDPDVNKKYPYMKVFGKALKYADPDSRPTIPEWGKINADLAITMNKIITQNLDPKKGLDAVAERTRKIMKEAGYYTWKE